MQVFAEINAALHGKPAPAPASLQQAVRDLRQHALSMAEFTSNERSAVLQMRKFVPLYLLGFQSAAQLQACLLQASTLEDFDGALRMCDWDGAETASETSGRAARLKGGREGAVRKVALPHRWLDDRWGYEGFEISDAACEG